MSDCTQPLIDETGRMRKPSEDYINLGFYCQLDAVINKKMKMCEIYMYPEIRILNETNENINIVKNICKNAEKHKVKLLSLEINEEFPTYLAFVNENMRLQALLYKNFQKNAKLYLGKINNTTIIGYVSGVLFEYPEKDIRGYYLRNYIFKNFPEDDQLALRELEQNDAERGALPEEVYTRRFEYLKEKDKFAGFNKWYAEIAAEALAEMKRVSESDEFKKFVKINNSKIIPFRYKDLVWPEMQDD